MIELSLDFSGSFSSRVYFFWTMKYNNLIHTFIFIR